MIIPQRCRLKPALSHGHARAGGRSVVNIIRRNRRIVQSRPLWFVRWADIPQLSTRASVVQRLGSSIGSRRDGTALNPPVCLSGRTWIVGALRASVGRCWLPLPPMLLTPLLSDAVTGTGANGVRG
jgi:hypothetical protein